MSRRKDKINAAADILFQYITTLLEENEYFSIGGFATLMNWKRSRRCFISMTDERLIILWLIRKYREIEEEQSIQYVDISSYTYKDSSFFPMVPFYAYNQKYFTPRLCIELVDKKILAFAFDDFNISNKIFLGLEKRLKHLQS
jgi:hypothetical protein